MSKKSYLLLLILTTNTLTASEVDNYSTRFMLLKDSNSLINQHSNELFDKVLEKIKLKSTDCDEKILYRELRKEFKNGLVGEFNKYIKESEELDRIILRPRNSIYGDLNAVDSPVLGLYSKYLSDGTNAFATVINVNGVYIGNDKFEHFTGTGFTYFENYYLKKNSIESTLKIGMHDEAGFLGAGTTGVLSYGDMTAEFNGMRFWNHILSKNPDILGIELGPYVKCSNKEWIKIKEIDFGAYVDPAWNEAMNCSAFRTENILNKVKERIKKLEDVTGKNYTCPVDRERITNILPKYGEFSSKIINIDGIKVKKD